MLDAIKGANGRLGVRGRLVALLLVFGLLPAMVLLAVVLSRQDYFRQTMTARMALTAKQIGDTIDRSLFERYGDVQAFGLNTAARDKANWGRPGPDNPLVHAMDGYVRGYGVYPLMLLLDLDGRVVAVNTVNAAGEKLPTERLYGRRFADAPWFTRALKGEFLDGGNGFTGTAVGQPVREPVVAETTGGDGFVLPFSAPLKDAGGKTVGVWVNFAAFSLVEEIVAAIHADLAADGMAGAELTVLDPIGRVLVDYDPAQRGTTTVVRDFEKVIGKLNLAENGVAAAAAAVRGESGAMVARHFRKRIDQAAGYAHSRGAYDYPGLDWSVLVRVPAVEAFAAWDNLVTTLLIAVIAAVAVILLAGWSFGSGFARPIRGLCEVMTRLAGGDTTVDIAGAERGDEIGEMARRVRVFRDGMIEADRLRTEQQAEQQRQLDRAARIEANIRDFEAAIGAVVQAVSGAATELQSSAQSLSATAEQTSRQSTAVAAATEQATGNVQTVATAAEELSGSIAEIGRQVQASTTITGKAVDEARRTDETVQGLADAAQRIGEVVEFIQGIAGQTNLLALNATIEAARAGDAGKGFAVVAGEVKSLANQTAKATEDIARQIAAIQTATEQAVAAIRGIGGTVGEVNQIATTIASAVEQQTAATQEISRNVQQAASGTTEVSQNITGVTQAAGETGTAAAQVLGAATELSQQAERLRGEVDRFLDDIRAA